MACLFGRVYYFFYLLARIYYMHVHTHMIDDICTHMNGIYNMSTRLHDETLIHAFTKKVDSTTSIEYHSLRGANENEKIGLDNLESYHSLRGANDGLDNLEYHALQG